LTTSTEVRRSTFACYCSIHAIVTGRARSTLVRRGQIEGGTKGAIGTEHRRTGSLWTIMAKRTHRRSCHISRTQRSCWTIGTVSDTHGWVISPRRAAFRLRRTRRTLCRGRTDVTANIIDRIGMGRAAGTGLRLNGLVTKRGKYLTCPPPHNPPVTSSVGVEVFAP
jgi:hypothetical protein